MWEKIVLNLVSNAFKFTFDGEVEVKLRKTDAHFELSVRDTGTGIPENEVPKLFERFHRVEGAHGRTHEGSGIGLALAQELARLHGGAVSAESIYGQGSTFRVRIPAGKAHLPSGKISDELTQFSAVLGANPFVEEALRWLPDAGHASRTIEDIAPPTSAEVSHAARPRIVLADDNADMRDYLRHLLASRYEIESVPDGEAAMAAIEKRTPDLVLADIMMPRLDGLGLLARLRNDLRTRTLPVILVSARAGEEARVEGLRAGADDYIVKPFSARELLAQVGAAIQAATTRREAQQALRESEERFRYMADNAPVMIWVTEPDGACSFLNESWYTFTGQTPETALGFGWLEAVHPEDRGSAQALFVAGNAKHEPLRLEYRLRAKDGEYRWAMDTAAPRIGRGGEFLGYIGSVTDITERKRTEETQRLLVAELNHRVKNTLASVQAIVQRTLRSTGNPADFAASFSGRLQSMARVHSMLSDATWQGADLRDLIRDQTLSGPVDESRITTSGPTVQLSPQSALHFALMLHELGTNSNKYGALSQPDGVVTIGWTMSDDSLHLLWAERGGPPVRLPFKRGFGTTLIEQSARGEGGTARVSADSAGITWKITLPLPGPSAPNESSSGSLATENIAASISHEEARTVNSPLVKLAGKRFLVVEDEPLVVLDIAAGLEEAGVKIAATAGTAEDALRIIESTQIDAALLDGNLRGKPVDDIAAALTRKNVPFLFITGYGRESLPKAFGQAHLLCKPFGREQLLNAAAQLVQNLGAALRLRC